MRLVRVKKEESPLPSRKIRTIKISSSPEPLPALAVKQEVKSQNTRRSSPSRQSAITFHDSSSSDDDDGFDSPEDEESLLDDGSEAYVESDNEAFDSDSDSDVEFLAQAKAEEAMSDDEIQEVEENELDSEEEAEVYLEPAMPTGVSVGEPVVNDTTPAINRLPLDIKNLILSHLDSDPYSLLQMFTVSRAWYKALAYGVQSEVRWRQHIFDLGGQKKSPGCKTWRASWLSRMHRRCMSCFKITSAKFGTVMPGAPLWLKCCEVCQFEVERFRCINAKTARQLGATPEDLAGLPYKSKHVRRRFRRKGEKKYEKEYFRASVVKLVEARAAEQARRYDGMVQRFTGDQQKLWQIIGDRQNGKYAASTKSRILLEQLFNAPTAEGQGFQAKCNVLVQFHIAIDEILANAPAMLAAQGLDRGVPLFTRRTPGGRLTWLDCLADGSAHFGQYLEASKEAEAKRQETKPRTRKELPPARENGGTGRGKKSGKAERRRQARHAKSERKAELKAERKAQRQAWREGRAPGCSHTHCPKPHAADCEHHHCGEHCPGPCRRHKLKTARIVARNDMQGIETHQGPLQSRDSAPDSINRSLNKEDRKGANERLHSKVAEVTDAGSVREPPVASTSVARTHSTVSTTKNQRKPSRIEATTTQARTDISDEQLLALLRQRTHLAASLPEDVAKRVVETVEWESLQQWRQERIKVKKEAQVAASAGGDEIVVVGSKKGKGKLRVKDEPDKENQPDYGSGPEAASLSRSAGKPSCCCKPGGHILMLSPGSFPSPFQRNIKT